ncbi:oxygen-independent coproporphyrinogen III oxidase [Aquamicrobium segne]|uniref:Coproporphyrinogen-III oxidase n=1 Tax=Aquamicrobium segne TaxID=469547 RepID=A0ABW0H2Y9_9HYPH
MEPSLLQKYGEARLPRYTSYPTAPHFSPAVNEETYADWLANLPADEPVSLYLHIPFCRAMCWYCGCHTTITIRDQPIIDYLAILRAEIETVATRATQGLPVEKVHFGGGTPTIVEPQDFIALVDLLRQRFDFRPDSELAVEIDPRTLTSAMAEALGQAGINRASLGVQSFDPVVQKAVNRIQSEEQTFDAVRNLRASGVEKINFDLIYGLPYQTITSCVETARAAAAMRPDRFAVFGYAHVPSFKKHQRMIDEAALPDSSARSQQAQAIAQTLIDAGYRQIGLDHFALPEDDLAAAQSAGKLRRNFQGYTTDNCQTLIGFGASAIGQTAQGYVQNEVALGRYAEAVSSGRLATAKGYRMTVEDQARAAVIERLMCDFSVDVPAVLAPFGLDPALLLEGNPALATLAGEGVVELSNGTVSVRADHRFLVRVAAAAFDAYLATSPRAHGKAA